MVVTHKIGSPPPMRGKVALEFGTVRQLEDHPRPCGEKYAVSVIWMSSKGSPPPMRGKASADRDVHHVCRITPAHAGKS